MKEKYTLAWRNLWRNKRRTLITVASVTFGVFFSTVMSSMQEGSYSNMVDNVVTFYSGYLQVHHPDYWENKTINNIYQPGDSLIKAIENTGEISNYTSRLESYTLVSTGENTRGAMIMGIKPELEEEITHLSKWLDKGSYLEKEDPGVLIAANLAKNLDTGIGDTIVMLSQGYHGATAAGKYPVKGILKLPSPELNNQFIYMDIRNAQHLFSAYEKVTSMVLMVDDYSDVAPAKQHLRDKIDQGKYSVMNWDEMQPGVVQLIKSDRAGGVIMKAILYMVIAFGILGTIIMMVAERKREMGVMVAVGMKKGKLGTVLFSETIFIGILGVITGFLISLPIIAWFVHHPVELTGEAAQTMMDWGIEPLLVFSWAPRVFYNQVITILILTMIISLYPVLNIKNMKAVDALRV